MELWENSRDATDQSCHMTDPHEDEALLDARGLRCPEPVMLLHNRIRELEAGAELVIWATDPSTERDIARFCQFLGHELLEADRSGETLYFRVRKAG
jgi:tRNA 2-thiouridine synthesizing protein A